VLGPNVHKILIDFFGIKIMFLFFFCIIIIFCMDINYFKKIRLLDGGMGQELLSKGLKPRGTLWSATDLIDKKYH